jgi:hypothetical protein
MQVVADKREELLPKPTDKDWIPISYHYLWKLVEFEDVAQISGRNFSCSEGMVERNKLSVTGKFIDNHHDTVGLSRGRQSLDEIHRHHQPRSVRGRKRLEKSKVLDALRFGMLTDQTRLDEVPCLRFHLRTSTQLRDARVSHSEPEYRPTVLA